MNLTPSKHLRLYEIGLGVNDRGEFKYRQKVTANSTNDAVERIGHFSKHGPNGAPSASKPTHAPTDLSIEVDSDDTTYVIRIDPLAQTAFGPGSNPIMILPSHLGKDLLKDVGLIDQSGAFIAAEDISYDFAKRPANAALTFRCNLAALKVAWEKSVDARHGGYKVEIPIYLNLYDTESEGPVWAFDDHRFHDDHQKFEAEALAANKNPETHGGIHPKTHGGIHPRGAAQFLYE